jgi:predicted transcriptional regulator
MDRILSLRVSEATAGQVTALARRLKSSKKRVIEDAVNRYAASVEAETNRDVFEETCGGWNREQSPGQLTDESRKVFRESMEKRRR